MTSHNIQGTRHCSLFNQKFNIIMCQVLYVRSNMWVKNIAELIVLDIPIYNLPQHTDSKRAEQSNSESLTAEMMDVEVRAVY